MDAWWTAERIDQLRALWPTHTATQIAVIMHTSKGSIVGKARRLRLPSKITPEPTPAQQKRAEYRRAAAARKKAGLARNPAAPNPRSSTLSAASLARTPAGDTQPPAPIRVATAAPAPRPVTTGRVQPCQWPTNTGSRPRYRFCDAPSEPGKPYCPEHCAGAYTKVSQWGQGEPTGRSAGTSPGKW